MAPVTSIELLHPSRLVSAAPQATNPGHNPPGHNPPGQNSPGQNPPCSPFDADTQNAAKAA